MQPEAWEMRKHLSILTQPYRRRIPTHPTGSFPLSLHGASTRCDLTPITASEATHTTRYAWDSEIQGSRHAHLVRSLGGRGVGMIAGYEFGKVKRKGQVIGTQGVRRGACGGLRTRRNGSGDFRGFHHTELSRPKRSKSRAFYKATLQSRDSVSTVHHLQFP